MSNSDNPKRGAVFQEQVLKWFQNHYRRPFEFDKKIAIGDPAKNHKFDIVDAEKTIAIECKRYTWTKTGNIPSSKMGFANEAAFYLTLLSDKYEKYIVMLKSHHPKRQESLAEYYYRTNKHLLGNIIVAEYDPEEDQLKVIGSKCHEQRNTGCVYFIRHGETIWNVENKICGATDIPLTEAGHQQAIETGHKILKEGIEADLILYSPLIRAAETAAHISEVTGIPARVEPRLIEQNFGKWESTPTRNGKDFRLAKESFVCSNDGGETHLRVAQRVYNLLDELKKNPNKTAIFVAHNGIARVVQSYFHDMTNAEYAAFGVKNCAVVRFAF